MLQRFVWQDNLKVGVPLIDNQHRELFEAVNDMADAIEHGQGRTAIKKLLAFMKYYVEWHFGKEEECAARHVCPIASTNQQAHAAFMVLMEALSQEYRTSGGSEAVALRIHAQLSDWLVSHIMKIDTQIANHICATAP